MKSNKGGGEKDRGGGGTVAQTNSCMVIRVQTKYDYKEH